MTNRGFLSEVDSDLQILDQKLIEYLNVAMDNTTDVGQNIADHCSGDENLRNATQNIMREFISMEHDIKQHVLGLNHIKALDNNAENGLNLTEEFDRKLAELKRSNRQDYKSHPKFKELEESLNVTGSLEEQLAALKVALTYSSNDDDDMAMTDEEINIKCPYTGQTMVTPVKNKICNHVYDKEGILGYIQNRKGKAKCPAVGCGNKEPITPDCLEEHTEMKKYITLLEKLRR
ncbi:unnamed protein product [Lymnaea stagnalis]|uniref:E3 SUMO-protein ligase NSE2 n=1 Tax=Lymnaea stagnalis TaxID=6523 RepID=A0AAV2I4V4_LYMST